MHHAHCRCYDYALYKFTIYLLTEVSCVFVPKKCRTSWEFVRSGSGNRELAVSARCTVEVALATTARFLRVVRQHTGLASDRSFLCTEMSYVVIFSGGDRPPVCVIQCGMPNAGIVSLELSTSVVVGGQLRVKGVPERADPFCVIVSVYVYVVMHPQNQIVLNFSADLNLFRNDLKFVEGCVKLDSCHLLNLLWASPVFDY